MLAAALLFLSGGGIGALATKGEPIFRFLKSKLFFTVKLLGDEYLAVMNKLSKDFDDNSLAIGKNQYVSLNDKAEVKKSAYRWGYGTRIKKINGSRILVNVFTEKLQNGRYDFLVLSSLNKHKQKILAYIESAIEEFKDEHKNFLEVFSLFGDKDWSYWSSISKRPLRPIETIHHEAKSEIVSLIENWINKEFEIVSSGQNYHIGFLFGGPPGGGKTSTAIAIASYLKLPLYVVSPGVKHDINLEQALAKIPPKSVLLIEECDELFRVRGNHNADSKHVSDWLSVLDGPFSPQGVIRVFTTNHPDKIDPSFFRPGRIDHQYHFPKFEASND